MRTITGRKGSEEQLWGEGDQFERMGTFSDKPTYSPSTTGDHSPRVGENTMDGSSMLLVYTCMGDRSSQVSIYERG